jgi:hypothetical protein
MAPAPEDSLDLYGIRGFLGDYEIEVRKDNVQNRATTVLSKVGTTVKIIFD